MKILSIAKILGGLSIKWLDRKYPYRLKALDHLVKVSGFTEEIAQCLLDALFKEATTPKLLQLLKAELTDPLVLDGFRINPVTGRRQRAVGPGLITHIFSGNVPNPAIMSFIMGMLIKSKNIGKVSSKDRGILDIYLDSLKTVDRELASGNILLRASGRKEVENSLEISDLVVVYGDDRTIEEVRKQIPAKTHFCGYGHRVSFSVYRKEMLTKRNHKALAVKTARDIWMMGRRGCLSPSVIYLERGGEISPLDFSQVVSKILAKKGRWLTLFEESGRFPITSNPQTIFFRSFGNVGQVYKSVTPYSKYLQAVALEARAGERLIVAEKLSKLGVNRICRAGQMQNPPITWHHDGMPNLASWVRWTDIEV